MHLSIDLETYSMVNLKESGLYKYVQSGDFQILLLAYSFNGEEPKVIDLAQGETIPPELLQALTNPDVLKHAYNAVFEWYCLSKYLQIQDPIQWLSQWRCTQVHGLYCGLPAGLEAVGTALDFPQDKQKLAIGKELIRIFSIPSKKGRILPQHEPEKWNLFKEYCRQDVVTEMEIENQLSPFPVPDAIQKEWELDTKINLTGIRLDMDLIDGAITISEKETEHLIQEARTLTGVENPKSKAQMKKWLENETGFTIKSLDKEAVSNLLESVTNPKIKRVLEIHQRLSKSSVAKYEAMLKCVCRDGRVRGLLQFYGARTGRWAGRLVQVHNLPRNYMDELDFARELVKQKNTELLQLSFGNVTDTLSQLIRTAFVPSEDCQFVVADYSAIEARVIAWLANEQWRMDVFRTHGKIYEASASAMFNVPMERIKKGNAEYALRAKGKVAELALGYGGSVNALKNMGALQMGLSEEELPDIVERWRKASPHIVQLWGRLEESAKQTLRTGQQTAVNGLIFRYEGNYQTGLHFLTVQLPSGRKIFYLNPFFGVDRFGRENIHYYSTNDSGNLMELDTYGGKLTENIVQSIARDCLSLTLQRMEQAGFQTVMHIHDEVVLDVPNEQADLETVCNIMRQPIPWAVGLTLNAAGFTGNYYQKD